MRDATPTRRQGRTAKALPGARGARRDQGRGGIIYASEA